MKNLHSACDLQVLTACRDVVWTDFDSAAGHEQKGKRPGLVLFSSTFNKRVMLAMVAPITSRVRGHGFEALLNGKKIEGVVLCQ
jgi:mRNA interferase MazF